MPAGQDHRTGGQQELQTDPSSQVRRGSLGSPAPPRTAGHGDPAALGVPLTSRRCGHKKAPRPSSSQEPRLPGSPFPAALLAVKVPSAQFHTTPTEGGHSGSSAHPTAPRQRCGSSQVAVSPDGPSEGSRQRPGVAVSDVGKALSRAPRAAAAPVEPPRSALGPKGTNRPSTELRNKGERVHRPAAGNAPGEERRHPSAESRPRRDPAGIQNAAAAPAPARHREHSPSAAGTGRSAGKAPIPAPRTHLLHAGTQLHPAHRPQPAGPAPHRPPPFIGGPRGPERPSANPPPARNFSVQWRGRGRGLAGSAGLRGVRAASGPRSAAKGRLRSAAGAASGRRIRGIFSRKRRLKARLSWHCNAFRATKRASACWDVGGLGLLHGFSQTLRCPAHIPPVPVMEGLTAAPAVQEPGRNHPEPPESHQERGCGAVRSLALHRHVERAWFVSPTSQRAWQPPRALDMATG